MKIKKNNENHNCSGHYYCPPSESYLKTKFVFLIIRERERKTEKKIQMNHFYRWDVFLNIISFSSDVWCSTDLNFYLHLTYDTSLLNPTPSWPSLSSSYNEGFTSVAIGTEF